MLEHLRHHFLLFQCFLLVAWNQTYKGKETLLFLMENYLQKNYFDECQDFTNQLFNHIMESLKEILMNDKDLIILSYLYFSVVVSIATETSNPSPLLMYPLM